MKQFITSLRAHARRNHINCPFFAGAVSARLVLSAFLVCFSASASNAQDTASIRVATREAATQPTCDVAGEAPRFRTQLPAPVLDYLERTSSSPFVHAFLLAYVAEHGEPAHRLTRCAASFREAPAEDLERLRRNHVSATIILQHLREAKRLAEEEARLRGESRHTLIGIVSQLLKERTPATVEYYDSLLQQVASGICRRGQQSGCPELEQARLKMAEFPKAQRAFATARDEVQRLGTELARVTAELQSAEEAIARDTSSTGTAASAGAAAVPGDRLVAVRDSLTGVYRGLLQSREEAATAMAELERTATAAGEALRERLLLLETALQRAPAGDVALAPVKLPALQPERASGVTIPEVPPASATEAAAVRSPNLFVELTDFVVERAKQELVLTFLTTLYAQIREDTLLQQSFVQTYHLMSGLSAADRKRLSAAAAGRIPLNVWRAAITSDFRHLPVNMMQAHGPSLCGENRKCLGALAQVRPLAVFAGQLLDGEPVLDILRKAPLSAFEAGAGLSAEWQAVLQGLRIVAAIAEAYQVQGLVIGADPYTQPFALSVDAIARVPQAQREMFTRLLVLRAAPRAASALPHLDVQELQDAVRRTAALVESIAELARDTNTSENRAPRLVRAVLLTFRTGSDVAAAFAPDSLEPQIHRVREHWDAFADAVEPIASRDFGLAMARTAVLLRKVTDGPLSRDLLTLSALAAGLAEAQTGTQVRAAFEAAASPVGGWQAKRYREGRRVTLTAFPGGAGGYEWMLNDGGGSWAAGISLPIGPEIQLLARPDTIGETPGCKLGVCSLGAFVPIVDLGTLLSVRLQETEGVKPDPNTEFRQVFAPGVFLSLGIGRSAFALLFGVQLLPFAREVERDAGMSPHAWKLGGGLVVDVQLFEF